MSIELHIFMQKSQVPSMVAWQCAIDDAGFPTVLDQSLDIQSDRGFSPATYKGKSTGFEFYMDPASEIVDVYSNVAAHVADRDVCATFRWGGDLLEMCAALSAAASLAKSADGIYFYPDDNIIYGADDALNATRKDLKSVPV